MERNNLQTIYWKEDYKTKLQDYIMKEEKTITYLKKLIKYFQDNNITYYNKFDKRDFDKIKRYFDKMIYYNNCQDNFSISYNIDILGNKQLYLYINNEIQYTCDIEISSKHLDDSTTYNNVLEQAQNRLIYVQEKYKQNKKILKNFDLYFKQYNDKVRQFKKFIDNTKLDNIIDIYIYAGRED